MLKDMLKSSGNAFLLGNEAIARGALEAGIDLFSCYPGTPSSEIGDTLSYACKKLGNFVMEYSANEKVAVEVAAAAAFAGMKSMAAMKHVGVNVASDALFSIAYTGVSGSMVVVTADDPSMHSSQNEQDNRWYALAAKLPVIEPSSVQEAKEYTKFCFTLSSKYGIPVLLRTYTRLSHSSGVVSLSPLPERKFEKVNWKDYRNPKKYVVLPAHARELKLELLEKMEKIENALATWDGNWIEEGEGKLGVIACGISYAYAKEAMRKLELELPLLKISSPNPLPEKLVTEFLTGVDRVIVVEEVDPFIEEKVKSIANSEKINVEVLGKENGYMPSSYEYSVSIVESGIAKAAGVKTSVDYDAVRERGAELAKLAPPRPPVFCPGCPHSATFYAIRKAVEELKEEGKIEDVAFAGDIGCYTLGINRPFSAVDTCICMGASVGIACGLSYALKEEERVLATIGDSTFFHAGIPPLINALHTGRKITVIVLDNSTTGMTGHQPHPGTEEFGCGKGRQVDIESVVRGIGVEFVEVVNSYSVEKLKDAIKRALTFDGVSVVISKQKCAILRRREAKRKGKELRPYEVTEKCNLCMKCVEEFACPALYLEEGKPKIDPALCVSCGVCSRVCPEGAIKIRK